MRAALGDVTNTSGKGPVRAILFGEASPALKGSPKAAEVPVAAEKKIGGGHAKE